MTQPFAAVILAAGRGTRMRSSLPKVLHPVCGRTMVHHVVSCAADAGAACIHVVVGHGGEDVAAAVTALDLPMSLDVIEQREQLGTGHAVSVCAAALAHHEGPVVILSGDVPLVTPELVSDVLAHHTQGGGGLTLVAVELADPTGYGRVVRDAAGQVVQVVEEKDADAAVRAVREVNAGLYVVDGPLLFSVLPRLSNQNAQGEYYLTDVVAEAIADRQPVRAYVTASPEPVLGVNSRAQLADVSQRMRRRINERLMAEGVTLVDPQTTYVDVGVTVGEDTVLHPGVSLQGDTVIGSGCTLHGHSRIVDTHIGDHVEVRDHCLIAHAVLEGDNTVGPSAHLRPGAVLKRGARVGNFVEIKATTLGEGTKVNHLSYVGDADVGDQVNIGAGTITCNYDGFVKHRTVIGDRVFIGSDTQLVAPVTIGAGAMVAAGSTVTGDVPADALAISRTDQDNRADWARRFRARQKST